jgi:hypothetical protein
LTLPRILNEWQKLAQWFLLRAVRFGQNSLSWRQRGVVGNASLPLVNQGVIVADAGQTITVQGNSVTNLGTIQGSAGGGVSLVGSWVNSGPLAFTNAALSLSGSWTNGGTISASNSTVSLGGNFTLAQLGVFNRSGDTPTPAADLPCLASAEPRALPREQTGTRPPENRPDDGRAD